MHPAVEKLSSASKICPALCYPAGLQVNNIAKHAPAILKYAIILPSSPATLEIVFSSAFETVPHQQAWALLIHLVSGTNEELPQVPMEVPGQYPARGAAVWCCSSNFPECPGQV